MIYCLRKEGLILKKVLVDYSEFHTSIGVFRRETTIYELSECSSAAETRLFFNGVEYSDAQEIKEMLGDDDYNKLKSEVNKYSTVLDCFMSAFI